MSDMEDFIDVKVTRRGREVAGRLLQVAGDDQSRRTQFGAHRSFSMGCDDLAYPSLRRAANIEAFWTCVKLFSLLQNCSSKRDVPTSPFEANGRAVLAWPTSRNVRADERVVRIVVLGNSLTAGWWATSGNVKLLLASPAEPGTSLNGLGEAELRRLTNGLPSRTNVCTRRKRTCSLLEEVRV